MSEQPAWGMTTRLVHSGERAPAQPAPPSVTPIYSATTFLYDTAPEIDDAFANDTGFVYSRYGNPTVDAFERLLADAERGAAAVAFASGMAAVHAAILAAGTRDNETRPQYRGILAARDLYGATTLLLQEFFADQGVPVRTVDLNDLAATEAALAELRPDMIVAEQISNPLLRVIDVGALAQLAHRYGARLVVDATMTTPIVQRPLELGADLVVHSATKYLGGHGDVTAGVVIARDQAQADVLRHICRLLGGVLSPAAASLTMRGVKTLALRVRQQCANAAAVAAFLAEHPQVSRVYYPGLPDHPQHALARRDFNGLFGAMVSFDVRSGQKEQAFGVIRGLRLILPGTSLGDVYTLITAPLVSSHRSISAEQRAERGIGDGMLRLSVGIEDAADIIADLDQALD